MSNIAFAQQFHGTANESNGHPFQLWPKQIQIYQQQSEILSHVEYPSLKNPRNPKTTPNPRTIPLKIQQCLKFKRGCCNYGDKCHFSHSVGDMGKLHLGQNCDESILSKLRLCRRFINGEECPFGARCHFLHERLEKVRDDLGLTRKGFPIGISRIGSGQLGSNKVIVNSSLNAIQVSQKPLFGKTRPCYKWEMTGNCRLGERCCYAHARAELQKLDNRTALVSEDVCTIKAPDQDLSTSQTGTKASSKQHLRVKKCLFKWRVDKISRIYADWIDYMPLTNTSLGKVGS